MIMNSVWIDDVIPRAHDQDLTDHGIICLDIITKHVDRIYFTEIQHTEVHSGYLTKLRSRSVVFLTTL